MGVSYKSCVSETGTLTGTDPGPYTVPNAATTPSGNQFWRTIASAFTAATDIVLNITNSSGFEVSLWSFTPGASGAAGTITRVQLLDSSTGATINWSGATVTIECVIAPPALTGGTSAQSGLLPLLNGSGVLSTTTSPLGFVPTSGAWYFSASAPNSSGTPNANTIYYVWVRLLRAATWTHMAVSQYGSPSAATNLRFGAYSADPTTGAPSTLLSDCGTVTFSTSVTPTLAFPTPLATDAPGFWAAVGTDTTLNGFPWVFTGNTTSARGAPDDLGGLYPALNGAQVPNVNAPISQILYTQSWTFGALPAAASSLVLGSTTAPLVSLQAQ